MSTHTKKTVKTTNKKPAAKAPAKKPVAKTTVKATPKVPAKKPTPKPAMPVEAKHQAAVPVKDKKDDVKTIAIYDKRHDGYVAGFRAYEDLLTDVKDMEANSRWLPGMQSKDIKVFPLEAPMFAASVADKYGMDPEMCELTATEGSKLYLTLPDGTTKLLDSCGVATLYGRACLFGSALGRMIPANLADALNLALEVAQGDALVLERYGKVAALHSDAAGGYCVMPISALLNVVTRNVTARCGKMDFISGSNSHSYTTAIWALPEVQEKLMLKYREALLKANIRPHMDISAAMPVVRFNTSDTATSSATVRPMFMLGKSFVQLVDDISVAHTRRVSANSKDGVSLFEQKLDEELYARMFEAVENLTALTEIEIQHPTNVIVGICNKFRIAKKYGNSALEQTWVTELNGESVSAHDVFLLLNQAISEAKDSTVVFDLGEKLCALANPKFDWAAYDVGGTVAWAN